MPVSEPGVLERYAEMDGFSAERYLRVWRASDYRPGAFPLDMEMHLRQRFPRGLRDRIVNLREWWSGKDAMDRTGVCR